MNQQETASNIPELRLLGYYTASSDKPPLAA